MNNEWPNNAKVYITGKDGFIGGRLSARFAENSIEQLESEDIDNIKGVFHLAAITDTTFDDWNKLREINIDWSKTMWGFCARNNIPFIYASSGAVYGDGSRGFTEEDSVAATAEWNPLNKYGRSKQYFDMWALAQPPQTSPPFWYGLRFFNVYGAHEEHKGKMASQVYQTIKRVLNNDNPRFFLAGEQVRDFVYVEDCVNHMVYLWGSHAPSGIYNSGTGISRSYTDIGRIVNREFNRPANAIEYFEMPKELYGKFQSHTQADMTKLFKVAKYAMTPHYTSLEDGIRETIRKMTILVPDHSNRLTRTL